MPVKLKKWLSVLCVCSLPVYSGDDVSNSQIAGSFVDNNILTTAAEMSRVIDKSVFLDIETFNNKQVLVGEYGRILTRQHANQHWQQAQVPVQTTITAVNFVDENTVWAVGHQGVILKSNDAGQTWVKNFDGLDLVELLRTGLEQQVAILTPALEAEEDSDRYDELEMQLDDATYKLEDLTAGSGIEIALFDVRFLTPQLGFVIGAYGTMLKTIDGGKNWQFVGFNVPNPDGLHLNAFATAADNLFVVGEAGFAMRTSDDGMNWQRLDIDYQGSLFGMQGNEHVVYTYGLRGNMFASKDAGDSWQRVDTGITNHIFAADWLSGNELLLVGAGGLKLIYDGQTFANISRAAYRVDLTAVKIIDDNVLTSSLDGWQLTTLAETVRGDGK